MLLKNHIGVKHEINDGRGKICLFLLFVVGFQKKIGVRGEEACLGVAVGQRRRRDDEGRL